MELSVFIGWDSKEEEQEAWDVCKYSIQRHSSIPVNIRPIKLEDLRDMGWYTRETIVKDNNLYDVISEHPMSTEFAISRFFTPLLAHTEWALFMDADMLMRRDIAELLPYLDHKYALCCTKHNHQPKKSTKMDGQVQSNYSRKNWSSFMAFIRWHPANLGLSINLLNSVPGRDLHNFGWLNDNDIGAIPLEWNHLVGYNDATDKDTSCNIHYTEGIPLMHGYDDCEFAEEFFAEQRLMRGIDV